MLFLCCLLSSTNPLCGQDQQPTYTDRLTAPIIVGCLGILYWLTAPQANKDALCAQLSPSNLAINVLQEYTAWALTTLSHETGHALVGQLLTRNKAAVHYGSTQSAKTPILSLGRLHIDGLEPTCGHTVMLQKAPFRSKRQRAAFLLAGGICGIIGHHLIKLCASNSLRIDAITIQQIISMLIPYHHMSDGASLWRNCAGASDTTINFFITITPYIEVIAEILCAIQDPETLPNTPIHSKILIGCMNYFMRGYTRLHA